MTKPGWHQHPDRDDTQTRAGVEKLLAVEAALTRAIEAMEATR